MSQAPLHWHAGQKKLEQLQADFLAWERGMNAAYPDTDTLKEFPDNRLRYVMQIVDQRGYFAQRGVATIDEQRFIAPPRERTKSAHEALSGSLFPAGLTNRNARAAISFSALDLAGSCNTDVSERGFEAFAVLGYTPTH
jgi:hypothetical protein